MKDVQETRRKAAVRIHVEAKVEQMSKCFEFYSRYSLLQNNANTILLICPALTNLEPPSCSNYPGKGQTWFHLHTKLIHIAVFRYSFFIFGSEMATNPSYLFYFLLDLNVKS